MPTDALDIISGLQRGNGRSGQRRERGETRSYSHEEVMAELDAIIA